MKLIYKTSKILLYLKYIIEYLMINLAVDLYKYLF